MQCLACGEQNPERARFCLNCGTALSAATAVGGGSREVRKTLTVLFADMVGFTALGERLDSESLRRVMDRFYAEMRAAIEREDGTVAKFIGDAVMAVWGSRAVREDDALRAVRAAEGMRSTLAGLNQDLELRWGVRIGLRTGVNTGEVVVDPSMSADLLVGDTINVAARLEQAAPDGAVYVGEETYRLVRDEAHLEAVPPLQVKGKARPVNAWRLVDGRRPERRRSAGLQAPLVGREREVARLRSAFYAATADRRTKLVTVIGSPGVGKSRLTAEFAAGLGDEAIVLEGRCEIAGEGLTFLPIAEVLRAATGIGEDDGLEEAKLKLSALLPDDGDRERIVDRAMALLGLTPAVGVEETFWAVRRLLGALARIRPVVLVIDDVHWAQPTLLDLHEHLVVWGRDAPLLVVAVARPELRETRPSMTVPNPMVSDVIELAPLAADDSRVLVERLLGEADLPPALAERVLETTEGNPLFLGEMLRMLVDDGVLRREGDRWTVRADSASISVPPTVNALLAARIERLSPDERCVVERAAVIGQQFYRGAVAELSPASVAEQVDAHLDRLGRKELVAAEGTIWIDEPVFRFHHVLIRDAAYRALLKEARADLHERYADWLEGKSGEVEELVAFHLERAHAYRGQLGPLDERGAGLGRRAAARLHSAGRRALAREDLPAAINLLERALVPIELGDEVRVAVLVDLAEALVSAGDTARAEWVVDELAMRAGDDVRAQAWAGVFACQLATLTGLGQARETIEQASAAAATLEAAGDDAGTAKAHQTAAGALAQTGRIADAEAALDRALVAARAAGDRRRVTAVLSGAPRAALWGPSPIVRASGRCLDVVRILRMTPGNRHVEAIALRCQAVLEAMRGRPDAARQILDGCRATLEELGLTLELHELALHAGMVELLAGASTAAEAQLRGAKEGLRALGVDAGAAQAAALLAHALVRQGRDDEALVETEFAELRGGEDLKTGIVWRGARAEALAHRGDCDGALALARAAVALSEPTDALADRADALMALAAVLGGEEGRDAARRARDLYAAKDHAVGVAWADGLLGTAGAPGPADAADHGTPAPEPERAARPLPPFVAEQWALWERVTQTRDLDAMHELYTEDFSLVDHRQLGWEDTSGRALTLELVDSWTLAADDLEVANEPLGGLDDGEIGIGWGTWGMSGHAGGAGFEVRFGLLTVQKGMRTWRSEQFDEQDVDAVRARFDELCAEHFHGVRLWRGATEPVAAEAVRMRARFGRCFDEQDWAGLEALFAPDAVQRDRRTVGTGSLVGARAIVDGLRSGSEVAGGVRVEQEILATAELADGLGVGLLGHFTGAAPAGGGASELHFGVVSTIRDGVLADSEVLEDDPETVLAHLAALRDAEAAAIPEVIRAGWERLAHGFTARDWDEVRELIADDVVHIDRRMVGWDRLDGVDDDIATLQSMLSVIPDAVCEMRLLAGARAGEGTVSAGVFAWRGRHEAGAPAELALGMVIVARGRKVRLIENFDADDRGGMLARYRELRAELLDAQETTPVEGVAAALVAALNERDWDAVRCVLRDDITFADRRNAGHDVVEGADAVAAVYHSVVDVVPDARWTERTVLRSGDLVWLGETTISGSVPEGGGAAALTICTLRVATPDGRLRHVELYDPDDEPRATARARAFGGWTAALERFAAALVAREWDTVRSFYDPTARFADHRSGVRHDGDDAEYIVRLWQAFADQSPDLAFTTEVLDVRSPRLGAFRAELRGHDERGGAFVLETAQVIEVDDGQRTLAVEVFDPGDGEAIGRRLDELEAARTTTAERTRAAVMACLSARAWDRLPSLYAPDIVGVDRRAVSSDPTIGPDDAVALLRAIVDIIPDARWDDRIVAAHGDLLVTTATEITGHDEHGGEIAGRVHQVVQVDADGLVRRVETFEAERDAVARMLEIGEG